jgi:phosphate transport system substrate-binding protein
MKISMLAKSAAVALVIGLVGSTTPAQAVDLQGSGASWPAPLIDACKAPFAASGSGHTYSYAMSNSGTGQSNSDKSIGDFWMSDSPYTAATKRASIIHVPLVAGPIAILHNLPSRNTLSLSASTIAGIFAGTITRWNDPAIIADNNRAYDKIIYKVKNGVIVKDADGNQVIAQKIPTTTRYTLPDKAIKVIYRNDSSGTVDNFTKYLYKSAPSIWTKANAKVFTTSFPGDINAPANLGRMVGAAGSAGVTQVAGKTPYSITFAETNYAVANKLKIANVINPAKNSVAPDAIGTSAFLASATQDVNGFLTFDYATTEKGAYPLGVVSYLLADTAYPDKTRAAAVKAYANFIMSPACALDKGAALGYAVISGSLLAKSQAQIAKIG